MESITYDRFATSETDINHVGFKNIQESAGRQNRKMYIMYGVLVVYLFIMTIAVGIKISQVSQRVVDAKLSLEALGATVKDAPKVQIENALFAERVMPNQGPCEDDWVFFKDSCYFQSKIRKSWKNAEDYCIQKKSHLVVVNDLEELIFVSSILKSPQTYWIGLTEKEEGRWTWVDGTDFEATEHHWEEGQPDNWDVPVNGEDCGQLHRRLNENALRLWNDADCTLNSHYLCEAKHKSR